MESAKLTPGAGSSSIHAVFYHRQRVVAMPTLRRFCVQLRAAAVRLLHHSEHGAEKLTAQQRVRCAELDRDGYIPLGTVLSSSQCSDIHVYLRDKELSDRHNSLHTFTLENITDDVRLADYRSDDILNCPHILELANSQLLLGLANQYIGCTPTISAVSLHWSLPQVAGESPPQSFHRDADDRCYLKVMIYLTDVGTDEGPHVYVLGSHLTAATARLRFCSNKRVVARHRHVRVATATGARGTAFAVDTAGIHKGNLPTGQARLLLQFQYSLLPTFAYIDQAQAYEGDV